MEIIKVAVIGVIGGLLALSLKNYKNEFSLYITMATSLILIFYVFFKLESIIMQINEFTKIINIEEEYISILIKMIGITYVAEFSVSLCKDMGYSALAVQIENFTKLSLLAISSPVVLKLLETIGELL